MSQVKRFYPWVDGVICNSKGVAHSLNEICPNATYHVVYNGCVPNCSLQHARPGTGHPWLDEKKYPVLVTAGRLSLQKDHQTLIHSFSILRRKIRCRLIIVGDGPKKESLIQTCETHGISEDVDFVGYQDNPMSYMASADVFVLTSIWEGFGNVLAEALSTGVPIVSTDCPSGPSEILRNGRYGQLVPVGDPEAISEALEKAIKGDYPEYNAEHATRQFRPDYAAERLLEKMNLMGEK